MNKYHETTLFVVSAPSGAGKTTVCRKALKKLEEIRFSISHTTRSPRPKETDGVDYHFVDMAKFEAMKNQNDFLEWANVYGRYYGTSQSEVDRAAKDGVDLLVEIDVQGAQQILKKVQRSVGIFIFPPSMEILEERLRSRGTDDAAEIEKRLSISQQEINVRDHYQYWIINDDLDQAVGQLVSIVEAERCKSDNIVKEIFPFR